MGNETERYGAQAMTDSDLLEALITWLITTGLLQRLQYAHRPDRTHGPTWIMHRPHVIDGMSCEGWSTKTAREALENAMREANANP